jgi:hypothetical protein
MRGCRGSDRMIIGFTTTCAIMAYRHKGCEFEPRSWRGVLYTTLCDKSLLVTWNRSWFPQPIKLTTII